MRLVAKSHSQKLRVLQGTGHRIVCALPLWDGDEVEFSPRVPLSVDGTGQTDRKPWVIRSKVLKDPQTGEHAVLYRFAGNECRVAKDGE